MSKHGEGKNVARDLFIYQYMTFEEIASQVGKSEKTIRLWADEGHWREERDSLRKRTESVHEKLYTIVNQLCDKIISDQKNGEQVDPGRLYAFTKLVDKLDKLHKYEGSIKSEADANKPREQDGLSNEALEKIEQQLKLL